MNDDDKEMHVNPTGKPVMTSSPIVKHDDRLESECDTLSAKGLLEM